MDYFNYNNGQAFCEGVPLNQIAASAGTPAYVYSKATLLRHVDRMKDAFQRFPTLFCYAVKANSNISVLREIFKSGFGADIVSVGELERALLAGVDSSQVVFSGVGKLASEIERALEVGILCFNVESAFELETIANAAQKLGKVAHVTLRVNPNIDAKSNPKIVTGLYTSKFGIAVEDIVGLASKLKDHPYVRLIGLSCHIGSQILEVQPLHQAAKNVVSLAMQLRDVGFPIEYVNMGGGLGIRYKDEKPPELETYAEGLLSAMRGTPFKLILEPGRVIVGNAGVLLTRVIGVKTTPVKRFVIVDAGINDFIRPSFYDSFHEALPVKKSSDASVTKADIVGPICESGDFFAKDRDFGNVAAGDLIYFRSCGAYGYTMASHYNTRPKPVEVLVDGPNYRIVNRRQKLDDLWRNELEESNR
ncbi:MAG: diaminopimelate decarboxylase [Oligoflexales bacterium]